MYTFDPVDYAKEISSNSILIQIYDVKAKDNSNLYWKYENINKERTKLISKGFKMKVINGWIKITEFAIAKICRSYKISFLSQFIK